MISRARFFGSKRNPLLQQGIRGFLERLAHTLPSIPAGFLLLTLIQRQLFALTFLGGLFRRDIYSLVLVLFCPSLIIVLLETV